MLSVLSHILANRVNTTCGSMEKNYQKLCIWKPSRLYAFQTLCGSSSPLTAFNFNLYPFAVINLKLSCIVLSQFLWDVLVNSWTWSGVGDIEACSQLNWSDGSPGHHQTGGWYPKDIGFVGTVLTLDLTKITAHSHCGF